MANSEKKAMIDTRREHLESRLQMIRSSLATLERDTEGSLGATKLAIQQLREEEISCVSQLDAIWIARMAATGLPGRTIDVCEGGDATRNREGILPRWRFIELLRGKKAA